MESYLDTEILQHVQALQSMADRFPGRPTVFEEEISRIWELYRRVVAMSPRVGPDAGQVVRPPAWSIPKAVLSQDVEELQQRIDENNSERLCSFARATMAESACRFAGLTVAGNYIAVRDLERGG